MFEKIYAIQAKIRSEEQKKKISHRDSEDYDLINNLVVKSNEFARSSYDLTLIEKRVLEMLISQLDSRLDYSAEDIALEYAKPEYGDDRNIFSTCLTAQEYSDVTGVKIDGAYNELKRAAKTLKSISVTIKENDLYIERSLMTDCVYAHKTAKIYAVFHQKFLPHLVALRAQFTRYRLKDAAKFKSVYSWRVYELIMSYYDRKKFHISVDDFRKILAIPKSYQWVGIQRILDTATEEIGMHINLNLEIERLKTGRKITSLLFKFKENSDIS